MTKHTLLVCKTCSELIAHDDVTEETITEGVLLLDRLQKLYQNGSENDTELNIEAVGCLWTCDRPCSITFACHGKYTYHFVDLHYADSISALQQFSQLYISSPDGYVKPPKMPGKLTSHHQVRVPPIIS